MLQTAAFFFPMILCSVCVPILFRRAGYSRRQQWFACLPAVIALFSMLSTLSGERALGDGVIGTWALAGALLVLVFSRRPRDD